MAIPMTQNSNSISVGFIVTGDETTASTRHRVLDPVEKLGKDIDADFLSFQSHNSKHSDGLLSTLLFVFKMVLFSSKRDILFIQKIPLPKFLIQIIDFVCGGIVFDYDDALYTSPEWEDDQPSRRSRLIQSIEISTAVITGNPNLSIFAESYNDNVYTLPTAVPKEDRVEPKQDPDQITIGWIGGPGNLRYLELIEEPLRRIIEGHNCELNIVTGDDPPVTPLNEHDNIHYISWSLENERELIGSFDLMIRPMPDTMWINGKGGYTSVIRCMSLGIPVVASPIDPLEQLTTRNESIFFAATPDEWYRKLEQLVSDDDLRRQLGMKARQEISTNELWTEDYAQKLEEILRSISDE